MIYLLTISLGRIFLVHSKVWIVFADGLVPNKHQDIYNHYAEASQSAKIRGVMIWCDNVCEN